MWSEGKRTVVLSIAVLVYLTVESQTAPESLLKEKYSWNPYRYPRIRSLSLAPQYPRQKSASQSNYYFGDTGGTASRNIDRRAIISQPKLNASKNRNDTKFQFDFHLANVSAINSSLMDMIKSTEEIIREFLITSQRGLLRMIGEIDQEADMFHSQLQGYIFRLFLAGQMSSAEIYHALPPSVNKLIERLRSPTDPRSKDQFAVQLNQALGNLRTLKKMLNKYWKEHELDFHNVFQQRFTQINEHLRVTPLPKIPFGWFPK